jgi:hypothetical protein
VDVGRKKRRCTVARDEPRSKNARERAHHFGKCCALRVYCQAQGRKVRVGDAATINTIMPSPHPDSDHPKGAPAPTTRRQRGSAARKRPRWAGACARLLDAAALRTWGCAAGLLLLRIIVCTREANARAATAAAVAPAAAPAADAVGGVVRRPGARKLPCCRELRGAAPASCSLLACRAYTGCHPPIIHRKNRRCRHSKGDKNKLLM